MSGSSCGWPAERSASTTSRPATAKVFSSAITNAVASPNSALEGLGRAMAGGAFERQELRIAGRLKRGGEQVGFG